MHSKLYCYCRLRPLRRFLRLALLLTVFLTGYNITGCYTMNHEAERLKLLQDPATGVVPGTEARTLSPETDTANSRAVLMVHGYLGSRKDFADLGERLTEAGFQVRQMRLPGHGTYPEDFDRYTSNDFLAAIDEEYSALKTDFDDVTLVGFSMGGALSSLYASQHDVDRLVLIAPYFGITHRWYYLLPAEWWTYSIGYLIPSVHRGEDFVQVNRKADDIDIFTYQALTTRSSRSLIALGKAARQPECLDRITCPVLLVMARGDRAASPRRAARAFGAIGSTDKQAHWFSKRSNHHLLWDWEGEDAKELIIDHLKEK